MFCSSSFLLPQPDANDNKIPEEELPVRPTVHQGEEDSNEIPLVRKVPETSEEYPPNVLMAHASEDSIFNKTEVLAGQSHADPNAFHHEERLTENKMNF